jgi:hypothetical protein
MVWWHRHRVQRIKADPAEFWAKLGSLGTAAGQVPSLNRARVSFNPGDDVHLAFTNRPTFLLTFRVTEVHPEREMLWTTRVWNNRLWVSARFSLRPVKDLGPEPGCTLTLTVSASGPFRFFAASWVRWLEASLAAVITELATKCDTALDRQGA